jgi:hypothetical protein
MNRRKTHNTLKFLSYILLFISVCGILFTVRNVVHTIQEDLPLEHDITHTNVETMTIEFIHPESTVIIDKNDEIPVNVASPEEQQEHQDSVAIPEIPQHKESIHYEDTIVVNVPMVEEKVENVQVEQPNVDPEKSVANTPDPGNNKIQDVNNNQNEQPKNYQRCATYLEKPYCVMIHPHFFSQNTQYTKVPYRKSIQIITQLSNNRMNRLIDLVEREWEGTISVAFYTTTLAEDIQLITQHFSDEILRTRLFIHFVVAPKSGPYPINLLRNISVKYATEEMVILWDIDFQPMPLLHSHLTTDSKHRDIWKFMNPDASFQDKTASKVYVVPAFEYDDLALADTEVYQLCNSIDISCDYRESPYYPPVPSSKLDLVKMNKKFKKGLRASAKIINGFKRDEAIIPFHFKLQIGSLYGHITTNYDKWLNTTLDKNYRVKYPTVLPNYEPYIMFRKSQLTGITGQEYNWCDETFFDRGKNKIMCVQFFDAYEYEFIVLHDVFVIHFYENRDQFKVSKKDLMEDFMTYYEKRAKLLYTQAAKQR